MPTWVKRATEAWTSAAGVTDGHVFRAVERGDRVRATALSEKVVWQLLQQYAVAIGAPGIAPHDLRRTCAKMCRAAGGELEQIQLLLGPPPFRRQSGTWARNRIWFTHRTTESNCVAI